MLLVGVSMGSCVAPQAVVQAPPPRRVVVVQPAPVLVVRPRPRPYYYRRGYRPARVIVAPYGPRY